jgi:exopolysaccharide biosynthesis polyprenyl glycosylphosphotransferase
LNEDKNRNPIRFGAIRTRLVPPVLQFITDVITISLAFTVQYFFRFESGLFESINEMSVERFFVTLVFMLIYWLFLFWFTGLYKNWYIRSPFDEFYTAIQTIIIGSLLLFFFIYLDNQNYKSPRMLIVFYMIIMIFGVGAGRLISRRIQKKLREKGIIVVPTIILGSFGRIKEFYERILKSPSWGYRLNGYILTTPSLENERSDNPDFRFLGYHTDLDEILKSNKPHEVIIAVEKPDHSLLLETVAICGDNKVLTRIEPDLYDIFSGQVRTLHMYGVPLIEISPQLLKPWQYVLKRFIDIIISSSVLIIGSPLWLIIAIFVKMESKGSVFYSQERIGKKGRTFTIFKFRTMITNAHNFGPLWTAVNDPRVTKFGRLLRRSHLDEVPQFINVLKGEMSLVGPRPEQTILVEKFSKIVPYYKRRHVVRPGITGWWQVKYTTYVESKEEIESRLKYDFYYIENMSLRLDFEILLRTILLVMKGHGQT